MPTPDTSSPLPATVAAMSAARAGRRLEDLEPDDVRAIASHMYRPSPWSIGAFFGSLGVGVALHRFIDHPLMAWSVLIGIVYGSASVTSALVRRLTMNRFLRDDLGLDEPDVRALASTLRWSRRLTVIGPLHPSHVRRAREAVDKAMARR